MVPTPPRDTYYPLTKALISIGRKNGFLLVDQLNDFLPSTASSPADLELLLSLFARLGVGVGATEEEAQAAREAIEPEFVLTEGVPKGDKDSEVEIDSPDSDKFNDPVRMYLKEMGTVPLLKREDEVEIAKRIEVGVRSVMRAI